MGKAKLIYLIVVAILAVLSAIITINAFGENTWLGVYCLFSFGSIITIMIKAI